MNIASKCELHGYTVSSYYYFLRASAMLKHVIAIGWTSVCPSVRPSHAGIVSKRLNLSSNCLHCLVAP